MAKIKTTQEKQIVSPLVSQSLIQELRQIIERARGHVAATANYALTAMYCHISERINHDVLGNERAEYGKQIVLGVSFQLKAEYMTVLPPHEVLQCQIKKSLEMAKDRSENYLKEGEK